jgi:hypothetical protein
MGHTNFAQNSSSSFTPSMVFWMDIRCLLYLYYYLGSLKLSTDTVCLVLFNCVLTMVLTWSLILSMSILLVLFISDGASAHRWGGNNDSCVIYVSARPKNAVNNFPISEFAESLYCHYNGQFYSSHPSIHVFLEVILDQQATTCIKMRNMTEQAPQPRIEREKTDFVVDAFQKYSSGEISRDHYVRSVRFRYRANTEM